MEVDGMTWRLPEVSETCGSLRKYIEARRSRWIHMEATGSFGTRRSEWRPGYVEARGNFHRIWLCKLQLIEVTGSFRFYQQWKFPSTFICSTSVEFLSLFWAQ